MPEIEISGEQLDYLDGLRADLEDRFVDGYGHVRRRDALQYLIDRHEADGAGADDAGAGDTAAGDIDPGASRADDREPRAGADAGETGAGGGTAGETSAGAGSDEGDSGAGGGEAADAGAAGADGGDGADRLQTMMGLLDRHDDAWEEAGGEEGKYLVTLPGGGTEHARTKDDVRALLFEHYR